MATDPARARETAIRAWLRTIPAGGRSEALARAADGHGLRQRAAEQNDTVRDQGTWYTPPELVAAVLQAALTPVVARRGRVCDPACGAGHFLLAVARTMRAAGRSPAAVAAAIEGTDIDPTAVAIARVRLQHEIGADAAAWRSALRCADALDVSTWQGGGARGAKPAPTSFALVVGNPPFLNQVQTRTAATRAEAAAIHARFDGAVSGYADLACAFLLLACELAEPGGRVALVLPMSVLATADAQRTRQTVSRAARLVECLLPPTRVFGGGVPTVVPVFERARERGHARGRARGNARAPARPRSVAVSVRGVLGAKPARAVSVPGALVAHGAWSSLLAAARGVPRSSLAAATRPLSAIATATADFRQHYYGLRGCLRELGAGASLPRPARGAGARSAVAAVATVGFVDAAHLTWGSQQVRLLGHAYMAPAANLALLRRTPELAAWVKARLTPKVIVATQTRTIEAWVDARGTVLPSTPLISVMPRRRADLWRVAAVLLAPPVCALAWWRHAGAALSAGALKLSARQVLDLPLPVAAAAWAAGARHAQAWHAAAAAGRSGAIERERFAEAMCRAYGLRSAAERRALIAWWCAQMDGAK